MLRWQRGPRANWHHSEPAPPQATCTQHRIAVAIKSPNKWRHCEQQPLPPITCTRLRDATEAVNHLKTATQHLWGNSVLGNWQSTPAIQQLCSGSQAAAASPATPISTPVVLPAVAQAGKEVVLEDAWHTVLLQQLWHCLPKGPTRSGQQHVRAGAHNQAEFERQQRKARQGQGSNAALVLAVRAETPKPRGVEAPQLRPRRCKCGNYGSNTEASLTRPRRK